MSNPARRADYISRSMASRIFSGIQPTGRKHLGNYIGAIRQYVDGQNRDGADDPADSIYCVVDLHAISVPYEPEVLREHRYDTTAILLAAGLDPDRCVLFAQSAVHEHTELCWLLGAVCAHGDLNRMTQFKEKSARQRELVSAALFVYPLLQAADVLAYRATEVPVGEDQRQHIELMRDVAIRFNERFGGGVEVLAVPEHRIPATGARIMDLQDPTAKMSTTSSSEAGRVHVLDEPKAITKKIKSAVTDSGSDVRRGDGKEGVGNLIEILAAVRGTGMDEVEAAFADSGYGDFKSAVADEVVEYLAPVRERYAELRPDEGELDRVLEAGAAKAQAIASETVGDVREAMGFARGR